MSEVKRYDPVNSDGTCGMCVEDADYGAYVEYADYDQLRTANQRLEGEVARLREALELIMEMQLRGFIVLGERATQKAKAALSEQQT